MNFNEYIKLLSREAEIRKASRKNFNDKTNEKFNVKKDDEEINQDQESVINEEMVIMKNLDHEETKVEKISGDDDIFYDFPETIDYEMEYEKFQKYLSTHINDLFGISVDNLNLNMDEFKKLFDSFGGHEELEKNLQIKFQPNILVNENVQLVLPKTYQNKINLRQRKNAQISSESLVRYTDQTVKIIPNNLEVETDRME